jgi:hypothetical protein
MLGCGTCPWQEGTAVTLNPSKVRGTSLFDLPTGHQNDTIEVWCAMFVFATLI